ncbi:MAG TPA: HD domain-containing phosphohydrolase [Verrucomicrobiae bacterium]|nr:HD domain-containing phosphohydrolase [Verrucomicrobiae bacterium]
MEQCSASVLFVDDNVLILQAAQDLLVSSGIDVTTAVSAEEALRLVRLKEFAVVVSDNYMPGISGLEFLALLRELSEDTVKILITAYADLPSALAAINRSEVFRYIMKPWDDKELVETVREGLRRYRILRTLRQEDEGVLWSLAQAIELKDPSTRGHCDRVAVYAERIAEFLGLPRETLRQIRYGSWLHDCGKIGVSERILNGSERLTPQEFEVVKMHSSWGVDVATKANLSAVVCNIIQYHHERFDGTGYPQGLAGNDIPLEARVVAVADVYDALTTDRPYRRSCPEEETLETLRSMRGTALDPHVVDAFVCLMRSGRIPVAEFAAPGPAGRRGQGDPD